jgi:inner membrane protein
LARGFFPQRPWLFVLGVVLAGTLADLDLLTAFYDPDVYLSGRNTMSHSFIGTFLVIDVAIGLLALVESLSVRIASVQRPGMARTRGAGAFVLATSLAAILHLLLDLAGSSGVALFWPFRSTRFAWDFLPGTDPLILALLLAGILLPELFGLIGSEIGAKAAAPRGRNGAIVALALALIYVGARATLHANAVAQLDAHTYRGELPQRLAAFADPVSLATWHGVVETTNQICMVNLPLTEGARFDPETGLCTHKPEDSSRLRTAQQTAEVKQFLQVSRFPKASVGATDDGTEIVLRDARDSAEGGTRFAIAVRVLLNRNGKVVSQETLWAREARLR